MSMITDYDENVQCYILQQMQRAAVNRHHHRWLHRYGFDAAMIRQLAQLADYKRLKKAADLPAEERNRPHALSSDMQEFLAKIHGNLLASYRRQNRGEPSPLEILISMAQVSDIELNRIYESYYLKNTDLFRLKAAAGGGHEL